MKIAHIINPVKVTEKSDLFIAQPITFETMRRARKFAEQDNDLEIELYFTCYDEDLKIKPSDFKQTKLLTKSILDYKNFEKKRKLPLIKDILDGLYESSDADYFIYTNVDIAVMPYFYKEVKTMIESGFDSFVINRRTINEKYTSIDEINQMYSDIGEKHPGYDCFVFKRDAYLKYQLGTACIGANWIGRVIISNAIAYSKKFQVFENEHLTFHIGDDRSWKVSDFNDYDQHNEQQLLPILANLLQSEQMKKKQYLKSFLDFHSKNSEVTPQTTQYDLSLLKNSPYMKLIKNKYFLDQSPVFIVGFPRSGTTLLQSLVATQGFVTFPETHFFNYILPNLQHKNNHIIESSEKICQVVGEKLPLSDSAKDFINHLGKGTISTQILFEILIMDNMLSQVKTDELTTKRWMEKTPDHTLSLDQISQWYPHAKFIFIMRNPLKAFASWRNVSQEWGIARIPVEKYCDKWIAHLNSAEVFQEKRPDSILFVKLENLVDDTSMEMEKIGTFLKINLDHNKLEDRHEKIDHIVLPSEIWKKDVSGIISKDISERKTKKTLTLFEHYRISQRLSAPLNKYRYKTEEIEAIENDSFSFMNVISDLSFFEKKANDQENDYKLSRKRSVWIKKQEQVIETKDQHITKQSKWIKNQEKMLEQRDEKLLTFKKAMDEVRQYEMHKHPIKKIKAIQKLMALYSLTKQSL